MIHEHHFRVYIQRKQKTGSWRGICILMFIVVLFTRAKIWKQPKCQQIKMCHTHTHTHTHTHVYTHTHSGILFSHEKEGNPAVCNNGNGIWGHYTKLIN